ncbi:MAG: helix-turn-helix domain-containing protein [Aigarchaeota archaeon]|nr:helix-turn-helix domain-containing protein [Aigarchaeota archaeon]MCX8192346.1 helix-turn-helix domain-containing protein [Nitrososphaeria archaeon]MDW7986870.1 helix-turn-helix domain-containing protein [Nitrososphaerota archaeon]
MVYIWRFKKFPESATNPRYMRILLYLKVNGPKSSKELAKIFNLKPESMRRVLQHLRKLGLVEVVLIPRESLEYFNESGRNEA